jgi:hypothetical protein
MLSLNWVTDEIEFLQKNISEIERIQPNIEMKSKLENIYSTMTQVDVDIDEVDNGLYKLHVGQYQKYDNVEIITGSEKLTGIVYESYGQRITVEDEFIFDNYEKDQNLGTPDDLPLFPDSNLTLSNFMGYVWIVLGFLLLIRILPNLDKFLNSTNRIISNPRKLISLFIIAILILLLIGVL